ncbi:MAG: hypothetical protein H0U70_12360 [Tatlockia sp.]|nr:hypothetical protein [Tatlockia sp.]
MLFDLKQKISQLLIESQALLESENIPRDFTSAKQCLLLAELKQEVTLLNTMLNNKNFEDFFMTRCAFREKDKNTSISFQDMPDSPTNQLYWQIAQLVFEPKTMDEMFEIVVPGIKIHLQADLMIENISGQSARELMRKAKPTLKLKRLKKFQEQEPSLDNFRHYVFSHETLFDAREIQHFPLAQQADLKNLLHKEYPDLEKKLYEHSSSLKGLSLDVVTLNNKGIAPIDAINQLIQGLILGGNNMTGQGYASKFSTEAVERFFAWFNPLPKQVRDELRALQGGNTTLGRVIDEEILKGQCVETTATNLTHIIQHNKALPLLTSPPEMRPIDLKILRDKYGPKHTLDTKKDSQLMSVFPEILVKEVIKRIKPETFDQMISLIIDFPPTFYQVIWKNLTLKNFDMLFYRLARVIRSGFFSQEQKQALAKAIAENYSRFNLEEPICSWVMRTNDETMLKEVLNAFTKTQRIAAIKFKHRGIPLLHEATEGLLKVILDTLPQELRLEAVLMPDVLGRTTLQLAETNSKSLQAILESLSDEQLLKLGKSLILLAIKANNRILLTKTIKLLKLEAWMIWDYDEEMDTLLHKAAEYPESLKALLEALPKPNILGAVKDIKDRNGQTVLQKTLRHFVDPESLKAILVSLSDDIFNTKYSPLFLVIKTYDLDFLNKILNLIPQNQLFQAVAKIPFNSLEVALENPQVIKTIVERLSSDQRFDFVNLLDENGNTILHTTIWTPQSLQMILSLLTLPQRFAALQLLNSEGNMVLHNAGRLPAMFHSILESFPLEQRLAVANLANSKGDTIFHLLITHKDHLLKTLELLPEEQRFDAINVPNIAGFTVMDIAKSNPELLIPLLSRLPQNRKISIIATSMSQYLKTLKPETNFLENDILNDEKLWQAINKLFVEKRLTNTLIQDLAILHQFHHEKTTEDTARRDDEDYIESIDRFYLQALEIRTSDKPKKIQVKEIIDIAHHEFHHKHSTRRLFADALMLVSILFAGLGLAIMAGRYLTNRPVFFSDVITKREKDLTTAWMKKQSELPEEDDSTENIFLPGG